MKKGITLFLSFILLLSLCGCATASSGSESNTDAHSTEGNEQTSKKITVTVGDKEFAAELNASKAAQEFLRHASSCVYHDRIESK